MLNMPTQHRFAADINNIDWEMIFSSRREALFVAQGRKERTFHCNLLLVGNLRYLTIGIA